MCEFIIETNINEADIRALKKRWNAALAQHTIREIKKLPETIQMPVYKGILEELEKGSKLIKS